MPRPFRVTLHIEEVAFGPVMRKLHDMPGISKIDLDLGHPTKSPNPKTNGTRKYDETGRDLILRMLRQTKTPQPPHLIRQWFKTAGRAAPSSALHHLKSQGLIRRVAKGYELTAKGQGQS